MIDASAVTAQFPALVLYARQWVPRAAAEDVVQEAFTRLLSHRPAPDEPLRWMYTVVRNLAIDQLRSNARRRHREQLVARRRSEWFTARPDSLIDAQSAENALVELSQEGREVIVLRIWGGLSFKQIAEIMQTSIPTTHHRYTAALKQMRAILEKPCKTQHP
jgi:RNA polymerase sigma factor (sigma-70 family)